EPDVYVLELSSFQLETTTSLNARAATVLNLTPDHMDRYRNLDEYADAEARASRSARRRLPWITDCATRAADYRWFVAKNVYSPRAMSRCPGDTIWRT